MHFVNRTRLNAHAFKTNKKYILAQREMTEKTDQSDKY